MKRDIFKVKWLLKPICEKLTRHKYNNLIMWNEDFNEFYHKCKICGYLFFNNKISNEDLKKIKE